MEQIVLLDRCIAAFGVIGLDSFSKAKARSSCFFWRWCFTNAIWNQGNGNLNPCTAYLVAIFFANRSA